MREIKFRIYDPYFETVGVFRFSGSTPSMLSAFFEKFATLDTVHGQKWEQYTGIKDKNGREIYEGDIIGIPEIVPIVVAFDRGAFIQNTVGPYSTLLDFISEHSLCGEPEVIGNIHESPELLN
jgi:hypothetical protein